MSSVMNFSKEDIDFIRKNIDLMSYLEMAIYFSKKYNKSFKADSISHFARRNGIRKKIRVYKNRKSNPYRNEYSEDMLLFLKENFIFFNKWEDFSSAFNKKFKTNYSIGSISEICRKKYGYEMNNSGKFQKNNHALRVPVGTERRGSGGYICIKVSENALKPGDSSNWKSKSRVIYEERVGEIPKGSLIVHLNGDKDDFDIENLYCVDKKVMACLARERWHKKDRELTLTAIKCAELMCKLNESEE